MSKKRKALQVTALLSAVSGATMIVAASSTTVSAGETNRVEERCWDQERTNPTTQYRMNGCAYDQYGLTPNKGDGNDPGNTPADPGAGGGGGGGGNPAGGGGYSA